MANVISALSNGPKTGGGYKKIPELLWKQRYLQIMGFPGAVWMIIFIYIPMYGITMAFTDYTITRPIMGSPWTGFKYFIEYFHDEYFAATIQNTLGISLLKLLICFPITIILALLLNELIFMKYKRIVQTITYLPHFLSWAVLGTIIITWFSEAGPVNDILVGKLHLMHEPIFFLAEPKYFWGLVVGTELWKEMGWNAIIFLAA
ncbi:MAG: sugar ABC transporter permease, partial [Clostridiales bacterium]|nr:sugar ABC transporter permease [Clostridiales bacterium]